MYIGTQTSGKSTEEALTTLKGGTEEGTKITGDLNARRFKWYRTTNARGESTVIWAIRWNYKIKPPKTASYKAKGRTGESTPDFLLDLDAAEAYQTRDVRWYDTSDHTPILYTVNGTNINRGKHRISKSMLNNSRNRSEAGDQYT